MLEREIKNKTSQIKQWYKVELLMMLLDGETLEVSQVNGMNNKV
jgi:hypothetical protein